MARPTPERQAPERNRRRHPALAILLALLALGGLTVAGIGISKRLMPRVFTPAQARQIQAWELAKRWRVTPTSQLFPATFRYQLSGQMLGSSGSLTLTAQRLQVAAQAPCDPAAADAKLAVLLRQHGCQALLRATYADGTSSLVMTVGMLVLRDSASAAATASALVHGGTTGPPGSLALRPLLQPVPVVGTLAATFTNRQRQLSWVESSGPYLVVATVAYSDGRPRVPVRTDSYEFMEMISFAQGGANTVMAPLGTPVPVPHCPGAPGC